MPPTLSKIQKLSHEENRFKCCAICYNESGQKGSRPITPRVADLIRSKVDRNYELNNSRYGASLCKRCNIDIHLLEQEKIEKLRVGKSERFGERVPFNLRSDGDADKCRCIICERATLSGGRWNAFVKMWTTRPGRPSNNDSGNTKSVRCNTCLTEVFCFYLYISLFDLNFYWCVIDL